MRKFLGLVCLVALPAFARTYNYEDIPVGERAFGMGNTSMAMEGSDTGVMFHNPALLGLSEHSQVSASLSAFSRIDTRTGDFVNIFRSAKDNVSRTGFLAIPSMVGGHIKTKKWVWGGTILVPFSFESQGLIDINADAIGSFQAKDVSYWYGAFAARELGNHAFGVALYYASRDNIEKFQFIRKSDQRIRLFEESFGASGYVLLVGGTYKLSDAWRLGYSLRFRPVLMGGQAHVVDTASDRTEIFEKEADTSMYPMPWRVAAGLSYRANPRLIWAFDLRAYTKMHGNLAVGEVKEFELNAQPIANVAVGAEYMGWNEFGIRGGLFTNLSSAQQIQANLSAITDKVHMYGASFALVFSKKEGTISLGGYLQGGQGHAPSIQEVPTIVPRSNYFYGFLVGSSYRF